MIMYYEKCKGRQLNQIVVVGSHDAGITEGGKNVQTQSRNILEQAQAGVRVFDLRIAGQSRNRILTPNRDKVAELKAYHFCMKTNTSKERLVEGARTGLANR
jgi:hypothetical protein